MSSPYIVSARKYRPSTFASVVGQGALTRTLKNAIDSGRLAQAYLFCGPRGVGKTSCARIFAKTINCNQRTADGEACGQCDSCRDFERGVSYNVIELDAASNNGVDHMRSLTEQVNVPPASGKYRVFIIDEVHMLSTGAFNAFLKTLEEPPAYAVFILATTEKNKVLPTILSRCQTYDFSRITERDIAGQLKRVADAEGIATEPDALEVIARKADGAMRDALSIFDQVAAASAGNVTYAAAIENLNVLDYDIYFRFTDAFASGSVTDALLLYRRVRDAGFDARFFIAGLAGHVRNMLVALTPATATLLEVGEGAAERYTDMARLFDAPWYYRALELLQECDLNYREASDKQLLTELTLIRLCQLRAPVQTPASAAEDNEPLKAIAPQKNHEQHATETPQSNYHAPVTATVATPPPPPRPRAAARPQGRSIRFNSVAGSGTTDEAAAPKADPPAEASPHNAAPASPDRLEKAWRGFIETNPDKKLLLTAMRRSLPEHLEGARYQLSVYNQAQLQEAENNLTLLADYLRQSTGCPALTLSVREQAPEQRPRHLTPAEMLAEMVKKNPSAARLLTLIDGEQLS